jgi:Sec-independent protein translocase protein TatA
MDFLGIGPGELILILIIALIFLGPGKIVDFARTLGKWVRAIKRAGADFTTAVTSEVEKAGNEPPPPAKTEEKPVPPQISTGDGERRP